MSSANGWLTPMNSVNASINDCLFTNVYGFYRNDYFLFAEWLQDPPLSSILWGDPAKWIGSMTYFPFDLRSSNEYPYSLRKFRVFTYNVVKDDIPAYCFKLNMASYINLGTIKINRYFNNFADFNGYTKFLIFLPYYGFIDVSPNDIIDKYLSVRLKIDYFTGQGLYFLTVSDVYNTADLPTIITYDNINPSVIYSERDNRIIKIINCQLGYPIPLGTNNFTELYRNLIQGAFKAVSLGLSATFGAPVTTSSNWSYRGAKTELNPDTGRQRTKSTKSESMDEITTRYTHTDISEVFSNSIDSLSNMQLNPLSDTPNNPIFLTDASQSVKIVRFTPRYTSLPFEYNHIYGKPLGKIRKIGQCAGYTQISALHIESDIGTASAEEVSQLESVLTSGVILPKIEFHIDTLPFITPVNIRWDDYIDIGGYSADFKNLEMFYDAGGVYGTYNGQDFMLKDNNDNPVQYTDIITEQTYTMLFAD